jgi:hypothetical protein
MKSDGREVKQNYTAQQRAALQLRRLESIRKLRARQKEANRKPAGLT